MSKLPRTADLSSVARSLTSWRPRTHRQKAYVGLVFASLFAMAAVIAISLAGAATSSVAVEAEIGPPVAPATTGDSATASGGHYAQFQAGTPTGHNPDPVGGDGKGPRLSFIPKTGALLGIFSDPNQKISSSVEVLEGNIGRQFDMRMKFYSFNGNDGVLAQVNGGAIKDDIAKGRMPILSWQASNWGGDFGNNHMGEIANGNYDQYLIELAHELKTYVKPIQLRFAHEMNGNWYGWSKASTAEYKAAWRHAHEIFQKEGATNVIWNWCPFWMDFGKKFTDYYPGDDVVDIVGIDVYIEQAGKTLGDVLNDGPGSVYATYKDRKPIMIMETMSGPRGNNAYQDKTPYFNTMVNILKTKFPKISGVVFFDENKLNGEGTDMSIATTSNGAANAANMAAFVNMTKDCSWGTDARQSACKLQ